MKYYLHPSAVQEHIEYYDFYEDREPDLGKKYHSAFKKAISQIKKFPNSFPEAGKKNLRSAKIEKFPISIIFRVRNHTIQILALAHHKRKPGYWQNRR